MRAATFLATVLCVLCLCSCGGDGGDTVTLTPADFGATVLLRTGQTLELALPDNPTTGYSWHRSWTPEGLLSLRSDDFVADSTGQDGAGGTRRYAFEALAPGQAVLTLQYGRWWTGGEQEEPHTIVVGIVH